MVRESVPTINSIFPNWRIKGKIGSGSYGKVYELERVEGDAVYRSALKIISIPQNKDEIKARLVEGETLRSVTSYYESVAQDLLSENRLMAELKGNSNIVSYEDHQIAKHSDGIGYDIFIRMELLTSFIDYMAAHNITEKTVIDLGIDICRALEVCEKKNIIHRDIKPGNIFVSDTGDFKLGDFGIARTIDKTTGGLSKKGTYRYMAPEVYRGEAYGRTVDICSLGLVMYYLMNGNRTPFLPDAPAQVTYKDEEGALVRRMRGDVMQPPRFASNGLSSIILKACAFDPRQRYQSASHLRRDLEALKAGSFSGASIPAVAPSPNSGHGVSNQKIAYNNSDNKINKTDNSLKKKIITVAVAAIIVVLAGVPLLLHMTKATADESTNITNAAQSDVKPDEESLEDFLRLFMNKHDDASGFDNRITPPTEAMFYVISQRESLDYSIYPGEKSPYKAWENDPDAVDPRNKVLEDDSDEGITFIRFSAEKVNWIMKNIFNYTQDEIDAAVEELDSYDDGWTYLDDGYYYHVCYHDDEDYEDESYVKIDSIKKDGDYYNVDYTYGYEYYDEDTGDYENPESRYTARMQYKEIDGEYYWSVFKDEWVESLDDGSEDEI